MKSIIAVAILAGTASANPRPLPFTYTTDTLPQGQVEIEQFADMTSLRAADINGNETRYLASEFQTEIEIGIADRLELGLYFTWAPSLADTIAPNGKAHLPEGNGLKQRIRYIFADQGEWPVDVGVYGELTENENEIEFEGKILLQRRFDRLRVAANLVGEYETYFDGQREYVINPSAGATYEVTPSFHAGIEAWMRGEYPQNPAPAVRTFGLGPETYVGPALMYNFGRIWWSVGTYIRVTDRDHQVTDGEPYGAFWMRSMIGFNI